MMHALTFLPFLILSQTSIMDEDGVDTSQESMPVLIPCQREQRTEYLSLQSSCLSEERNEQVEGVKEEDCLI